MIIHGYWLNLMWAVLAGGWFISALIRLILVSPTWTDRRGRRLFAVIVHTVVGVFFVWRHNAGPLPLLIPIEETYRNLAAVLLVTWVILDGIWAIQRTAERPRLARPEIPHDHA
ncbi:hypothetical protein [Deinococcus sp.]|uniref:hypothetical protein n=1 Tax=Deinococcus sp. TaxID=47478 RepID=UPI0025C1AF3F|nr:hypothetical protein [Deinococcus sp.]